MVRPSTAASLALRGLPWPLPAVLAWAAAWLVWLLLAQAGFGAGAACAGAVAASVLLAMGCKGRSRQVITAAGFPMSALALGAAPGVPAWAWLLLLLPMLLAYPLRAWRDAPFFPTPTRALSALPTVVRPAPASMLDVGCGLGHGLAALHALWPQARAHGVESSAPLAWLTRRRCRYAHVTRGDMWAADWSGHDLIYAFQRPDNMARIWAKAQRELAPGAWLVSLEFPVPGGIAARTRLVCPDGRDLWIYQMPSSRPSPTTGRSTARRPSR